MTKEQCKAARASLGIGQRKLADLAGAKLSAVCDFEVGRSVSAQLEQMESALADAGIEFQNGRRPGVRMKRGLPKIPIPYVLV